MACHRCILVCLLLSNALHQLSNCSSQTNSSYNTFLIALSSKQPVGNFYVYLPSSIILLFYMNRCEDCDILVVSCKSTTEKRSMSTKVEVQSSLHLLKMPPTAIPNWSARCRYTHHFLQLRGAKKLRSPPSAF